MSLALSCCLLVAPARGETSDSGSDRDVSGHQLRVESFEDITEGFFRDAAYVYTAPFRPTKKGLIITGSVAAGTGVLMGWDRKISNSVQHSKRRTLRKFLSDLDKDGGIERFGRSSGVMMTCGAFYGLGFVSKNRREKEVAYMGVEAWVINEIATGLSKQALGRSRPGGRDPYDFDSFGGNSSMPSGHTSTAFTMASVVASQYDNILIDTLAYGTATTVGLSRLYRDVHWASDVLVSAAMGISIGKAVSWMYRENPRDWSVVWSGEGVKLTRRF